MLYLTVRPLDEINLRLAELPKRRKVALNLPFLASSISNHV
jgi:hypothetical protein